MISLQSTESYTVGHVAFVAVMLFFLPSFSMAEFSETMKECMLHYIEHGDDAMTLGQMKAECRKKLVGSDSVQSDVTSENAVEQRLDLDEQHILQPYTLMSHKPNYILFAAYNSNGYDAELFREQYSESSIYTDDVEAQFQLSIKTPLAVGLFGKNIDIYAAYTNRSFWQVYNKEMSAPFRETNHEPDAWVQFRPEWNFFGFTNSVNALGIVHQSNGQGGVLSRSWNRVYANFVFDRDNFAIGINPWWRIPEDAEDDDNEDIDDYLGYGEIRAAYKMGEHTFSMMTRNLLATSFDKGAVEFSWSFPIWNYDYFKGYLHYFNGYGESLIDYNHRVNSFGIGIALTDYL